MAYVSNEPPSMQNTQLIPQPMMTGPVMVPQIPRQRLNIKIIKGLGITQIIIGILSIGIGLGTTVGLSKDYWVNDSAGGIWGGVWIMITGIIGVSLAFNANNGGLLATHMIFCIISTVIVFFDGIFFAIALAFYNNCNLNYYQYTNWDRWGYYYAIVCKENRDAARALYSLLIILMVTEFFVALIASIYSCNSAQCCRQSSPGRVIIQQQPAGQAQYIMASSSGQTYMTPGPAAYNPQQGGMLMPHSTQVVSAPYTTYPHHTAITNHNATTSGVTYTQENDAYKSGPPPLYTATA